MSQENVEIVGEAYEVLRRSGVEAFSAYWAEDIEWQTMRSDGAAAGCATGRAVRLEPLEFFDAGDDRVVIYLRYGGRSKRGGVQIPPEYFAIVTRPRRQDRACGRVRHEARGPRSCGAVGVVARRELIRSMPAE